VLRLVALLASLAADVRWIGSDFRRHRNNQVPAQHDRADGSNGSDDNNYKRDSTWGRPGHEATYKNRKARTNRGDY
jgi:hypothetical protein